MILVPGEATGGKTNSRWLRGARNQLCAFHRRVAPIERGQAQDARQVAVQRDRERPLALLADQRQLDPVDQAAHDRGRLGLAIRVGQGSAQIDHLIP
jgi:hypothetical protein